MSRISDIKNHPQNNFNILDILSLLTPVDKSKYVETLLRLMKNMDGIDERRDNCLDQLHGDYNLDYDDLSKLSSFNLVVINLIITYFFTPSEIENFKKFCDYNEKGLVKKNDLSTYHSFNQISEELTIVEIDSDLGDLKKQIKVVFENDEWILVRPLSFLSSVKYGSNTTWCTTMKKHTEYFFKYADKGVLIYSINKKTGYKVATFYSLQKSEPEFSFWDQKDRRVDSMETKLTDELRQIIYQETHDKNSKPNRFYLTLNQKKKEDKILEISLQPSLPNTNRINYILRSMEEIVEGEVQQIENGYFMGQSRLSELDPQYGTINITDTNSHNLNGDGLRVSMTL